MKKRLKYLPLLLATTLLTGSLAVQAQENILSFGTATTPSTVATENDIPDFGESTGYGVLLSDESVVTNYDKIATPDLSTSTIYQRMMDMQSTFPEGMRWTNDNYYGWRGGYYSGGYGCAGFAFALSDAAFEDLPARILDSTNYNDIRVGDILRLYSNSHSVIVLEKYDDYVVVAEGNYNSSIHWGRRLYKDNLRATADGGILYYIMTRYPENYNPTPAPTTPPTNGWFQSNGKSYWYENNTRQGTFTDPKGVLGNGTVRGREIYDPASDAWYWLDSIYEGAKAIDKEVWMPYIYQNEKQWSREEIERNAAASGSMKQQVIDAITQGKGKWVRYDHEGRMIKGWYVVTGSDIQLYPKQAGCVYYYDPKTGLMAKGTVIIDGVSYTFDEKTGALLTAPPRLN